MATQRQSLRKAKAKRRFWRALVVCSLAVIGVFVAAFMWRIQSDHQDGAAIPRESTDLKEQAERYSRLAQDRLKDLPKETQPLIDEGLLDSGSWEVHSWTEPYDLTAACKDYVNNQAHEAEPRKLVTSGYLDIAGNVWTATWIESESVVVTVAKASQDTLTLFSEYRLSKDAVKAASNSSYDKE